MPAKVVEGGKNNTKSSLPQSNDHPQNVDQKSVIVAYVLLLLGGCLGLHHLYLRRYRHALLWFSTFGLFTFGALVDIFELPRYVKRANGDPEIIEALKLKQRYHTQPPFFAFKRLAASLLFAFLYRSLFSSLVQFWEPVNQMYPCPWPFHPYSLLFSLFSIPGAAMGVYLAQTASGEVALEFTPLLKYAAIGEGLWILARLKDPRGEGLVGYFPVLLPLLAVWFYRKWAVFTPQEHLNASRCKRWVIILTVMGITSCLIFNFAYHNMDVTLSSGTAGESTVKLKEAFSRRFSQADWKWEDLFNEQAQEGWHRARGGRSRRSIQDAKKALGLSHEREITLDMIKKARNRLAVEYHPDKHPADEKDIWDAKFHELQQAYEILTEVYSSS